MMMTDDKNCGNLYTLLNNDYLSVSFAVEKYHQHILFNYSSHFEIAHLFQYDVEKCI